jgi:hypothetical protein
MRKIMRRVTGVFRSVACVSPPVASISSSHVVSPPLLRLVHEPVHLPSFEIKSKARLLILLSWSNTQTHPLLPLQPSFPSRFPARTGIGRVGLRNACHLWVRLLGWRTAITFLGSVVGGMTTRFVLYFLEDRWWSTWLLINTASSGTTTLTGTMSSSVSGSKVLAINP